MFMKMEIPLLNNISYYTNKANMELEGYFDVLNEKEHYTSLVFAIPDIITAVELSIKFRLLTEHWGFVFADIDKASATSFSSGDFKSVDFNQGICRIRHLCEIDKSLEKCSRLYKLRNKIQHFQFEENLSDILGLITSAIEEFYNFAVEEVITHIENPDAVKSLKDSLQELKGHSTVLKKIHNDLNNFNYPQAF